MKKFYIAALSLMAVACGTKENPFSRTGDEIRFSAVSGAGTLTKTEYSGEDSGGKERIDWVAGDLVRIASDKAVHRNQASQHWADYKISGTITPDRAKSRASIEPAQNNGLVWGSGAHQFYGVYPSSVTLGADGQISPAIAPVQSYSNKKATVWDAAEEIFVYPNMDLALMAASVTASPGNSVELVFKPMVTTFRFTVGGSDADVTLQRMELSSSACALSGSFTAVLSATSDSEQSTIAYTVPNLADGNGKVTFNLADKPCVVNSGKKLTFTLFVLPSSKQTAVIEGNGSAAIPYLDELTLRFYTTVGGDNKVLALPLKYSASAAEHPGEWVKFPAGKKIHIRGVTVPSQDTPWTFSVGVDDWADELSDVVVSPVQMTEFEYEEGAYLDGSMVLDLVHPSDISHKGGVSTYGKVQSYRSLDGGATKTSVPWVVDGIYATEEDALAGQNPLSDSFVSQVETPDYLNSNAAYYNRLTITYGASSGALTRDTGEEIDAWLMAQAPVGSPSAYQNLANPANPGSYEIAESANTYIVNAPGYYRLPLVVGNGIKNNQVNNAQFVDGLGKDNFDYTLSSYWDYTGTEINNGNTSGVSPWLHETSASAGTPTTAFVVWEDVDGLIEAADADYNLPAGAITSPDGGTTYWLNFHIPSSAIRQGNAVLAVADGNGAVMWSWLIWVTNYVPVPNRVEVAENIGTDDAEDVGQDVIKDYYMRYPESKSWSGRTLMARNLGWVEHVRHYRHAAEGVWLRIRQDVGGGKVAAMRVFRDEKIVKENLGRQPYFQGGRKDAMQPVQMGASVPVPVYGKYGGSERRLDPAANVGMGYLIQHPEVFHTGTRRQLDQTAEGALWGVNLGYNSSSQNKVVHKTIYDPSPAGYTLSDWGLYQGFAHSITTDPYGGIQYAKAWVKGEFEDGFWFYGREHNYGKASIFYPATGYITENGDVVSGRTKTLYWTYRAYGFSFGNAFEFDENSINQKTLRMKAGINEGYPRNCGAAIRPIRARE